MTDGFVTGDLLPFARSVGKRNYGLWAEWPTRKIERFRATSTVATQLANPSLPICFDHLDFKHQFLLLLFLEAHQQGVKKRAEQRLTDVHTGVPSANMFNNSSAKDCTMASGISYRTPKATKVT